MAFPNDDGEFIRDTNTSDDTIGVMLTQIQIRVERVIVYSSWMLGKSEHNYCVTNRQLLAVKYFVGCYEDYLLGWHFRVCSDPEALKWLLSLKESKRGLARWIKALSKFDFEAEYWPGKKHGNADILSKCWNLRDWSCLSAEESRLLY